MIEMLKVILAQGETPASIGYFETGPNADTLFVSATASFDRSVPPRMINATMPKNVFSAVRITEMHRQGKTAEEIVAAARKAAPKWVS